MTYIMRGGKVVQIKAPCCVVDQFCLSPANVAPLIPCKTECFACGLPVCTECSTIRKYYNYGKVRLCNDCQIQYDGNDKRVMARLRREAGYTVDSKETHA